MAQIGFDGTIQQRNAQALSGGAAQGMGMGGLQAQARGQAALAEAYDGAGQAVAGIGNTVSKLGNMAVDIDMKEKVNAFNVDMVDLQQKYAMSQMQIADEALKQPADKRESFYREQMSKARADIDKQASDGGLRNYSFWATSDKKGRYDTLLNEQEGRGNLQFQRQLRVYNQQETIYRATKNMENATVIGDMNVIMASRQGLIDAGVSEYKANEIALSSITAAQAAQVAQRRESAVASVQPYMEKCSALYAEGKPYEANAYYNGTVLPAIRAINADAVAYVDGIKFPEGIYEKGSEDEKMAMAVFDAQKRSMKLEVMRQNEKQELHATNSFKSAGRAQNKTNIATMRNALKYNDYDASNPILAKFMAGYNGVLFEGSDVNKDGVVNYEDFSDDAYSIIEGTIRAGERKGATEEDLKTHLLCRVFELDKDDDKSANTLSEIAYIAGQVLKDPVSRKGFFDSVIDWLEMPKDAKVSENSINAELNAFVVNNIGKSLADITKANKSKGEYVNEIIFLEELRTKLKNAPLGMHEAILAAAKGELANAESTKAAMQAIASWRKIADKGRVGLNAALARQRDELDRSDSVIYKNLRRIESVDDGYSVIPVKAPDVTYNMDNPEDVASVEAELEEYKSTQSKIGGILIKEELEQMPAKAWEKTKEVVRAPIELLKRWKRERESRNKQ